MKKKNEDLKLDVLSNIEPQIVEEVTDKRVKLSKNVRSDKGFFSKKKLIAIGSVAASFVLVFSVLFGVIIPMLNDSGSSVPGPGGAKQIPIYQGMSVSSEIPSLLYGNTADLIYLSGNNEDPTLPLNEDNNNGNNGNHGNHGNHGNNGNINNDGDGNNKYKDKHTPVDVDKVVDEDYTPPVINDSLTVNGTTKGIYYATPNTDVYITVHLSNPDQFEILSFTLNGYKYQSYQFENGSDSENLILKVKVGDVGGIHEYTIDAIKYIDGTETKDVKMEGDKTVKIGVYTDGQLVPTVENEYIGFNDISFELSVEDTYGLIPFSEGKVQVVLCDGESIIYTKDIVLGENNSVKFEGLTTDAQYGYAIIATYDSLDGDGIKSYTIYEKAFKTKSKVDFDNTAATKDGLTFDIIKAEAYANLPIDSITVYKGDEKVKDIDVSAKEVTGLLSNTEYTIIIGYTNNGNPEVTEYVFKTLEKTVPSFEIKPSEPGQTNVGFDISENDPDNVGEVIKIELVKGDNVTVAENTGVREFNGLLSNNDYTIKVTYKYDLNDGVGEQEIVKIVNVKTKAKSAPTVTIVNVEKSKDSISFGITKTDIDSILNITSIKIGDGKGTVKEFSLTDSAFSINGLVPNTEYKISVEYEYDLNDGKGIQKKTVNNTVYTAPIVTVISSKCINTTAISKGDTIVLRITTEDIGNAQITAAKVNGIYYSISELSASTSTIIEIVYSDQFEGGDTELILEELIVLAYGESYTLEIGANNKTSCFVYGDFDVESIALTDETGKPVEYLMPSDQAYYYIKLQNSTGYEVVGVELLNSIYTQYVTFGKDSIKMLDNNTLMIPFDHTVISGEYGGKYYSLKSVTFINASGDEETRTVETESIHYNILEKDGIVEISKPEDLKNMGTAAYYKLMCDIDLSELSWDAPGEFRGYFDGNGHTISGMTVVKTYTDQSATLGLFSYSNGFIKDLTVKDTFIIVTVKNERLYYGCIAGRGVPTLRNVTVSGSSQFTASDYVISYCRNDGNVNIGETILVNKDQVEYRAMERFNNWNLTTDAEKYQVTYSFETNGGEPMADRISVFLGNIIPKKDLHMFLGWYDNAEFEGEPLSPAYRTEENVKVYAKWMYTGINENQGLEMSEDGFITGIGTCTDKVLVLNAPISSSAFENCKTIEKVYLGPKVTGIGDNAFMGCTGLKEVVMADGIEAVFSAAFRDCTALEKINLPDTVIEFHSYELFYGCENLKEIVLPNGITEISERAFAGCTSLESIKIPSTVKTIRPSAFIESGLKEISLPEGITEIAQGVFEGCSYLEKIDLPDSLVNIEIYAFQNCSKLKEIKLGNKLVSIGMQAFCGCASLESVTIGNGVTSIGNNAFYDCKSLESINIPDSVKTIGESTFMGCTGLTSVTIGNGVTSIGKFAFSDCENLKVYITDIESWLNISFGDVYARPNYYGTLHILDENGNEVTELIIPDSVTSIGELSFKGCTGLTSVTIGNGVTSIGNYAFESCASLESVNIPDSVMSIGISAFERCASLESVNIPDSVTSIGGSAFLGCKSLESITIPDSVTSIGGFAFYACTGLTSVTIGNGVTSIGSSAFYACTGLTSINIPDGVKSIGSNAFLDCKNLKDVYITDVEAWLNISFGDSAHPNYYGTLYILDSNGNEVTELVIPNTVKTIGEYAFYGCEGLMSINIPNSVTSIGDYAFCGCTSLISITIPDSVTSIGKSAFSGCDGLTSITIPDGVKSIGENAFYYCYGLTSITIGKGVKRINSSAFSYCYNLTDINFCGTKEEWGKITKYSDWNENTGNYIVHCTDGDLTKEES